MWIYMFWLNSSEAAIAHLLLESTWLSSPKLVLQIILSF